VTEKPGKGDPWAGERTGKTGVQREWMGTFGATGHAWQTNPERSSSGGLSEGAKARESDWDENALKSIVCCTSGARGGGKINGLNLPAAREMDKELRFQESEGLGGACKQGRT